MPYECDVIILRVQHNSSPRMGFFLIRLLPLFRTRARAGPQQHANLLFVLPAVFLSKEMVDLPAVFRVENRDGHRTRPTREHGFPERGFSSWYLPVIRENGLIA